MKHHKVPIVDKKELRSWDTKRLLKRRDSLLKCEYLQRSDMANEITIEVAKKEDYILFREDERWEECYNLVRDILQYREHIPNSIERKAKRIARSKLNKTKEKRRR